jgi:hypothetical protein
MHQYRALPSKPALSVLCTVIVHRQHMMVVPGAGCSRWLTAARCHVYVDMSHVCDAMQWMLC